MPTMTTTACTATSSHQVFNATKGKLNIPSKTTRALPSALFLHGSDWDSINLTPYESETCKIAFDNLCLLAWESDNLSSWRIESELGIISSEWAEKKKGPGKACMRDALPEALKFGWRVRAQIWVAMEGSMGFRDMKQLELAGGESQGNRDL